MAGGVATDALLNLALADGLFEGFLQPTFVEVVANDRACAGISAASGGRESVLPDPLATSAVVFAMERMGE